MSERDDERKDVAASEAQKRTEAGGEASAEAGGVEAIGDGVPEAGEGAASVAIAAEASGSAEGGEPAEKASGDTVPEAGEGEIGAPESEAQLQAEAADAATKASEDALSEPQATVAGAEASGGPAGEAPAADAEREAKRAAAREARAAAKAAAEAGGEADGSAAGEAPAADAEREAKRAAAREARAAAKAAAEAGGEADAGAGSDASGAPAERPARAPRAAAPRGEGAADAPPAEPKAPSPLQPRLDAAVALVRELAGADAIEEAYVNELGSHVPTIVVRPAHLRRTAELFKEHAALGCRYLRNVSGVDYETHLETVYHLVNLETGDQYTIKARADRSSPVLDSVTPVWATANWNEREIYDLLGIHFAGHPDLRRIMMSDDWVGHPLRKDYEPFDPEV